ncbi:MAG TPA: cation transporter, partial [Thiothrix sp.]|nr:cation transporter [Thiothrix sp.]
MKDWAQGQILCGEQYVSSRVVKIEIFLLITKAFKNRGAKMENEIKYESSTYYIDGMHCIACELLIEKELKALPNVKTTDVSFGKKTIVVEHLKEDINPAKQYNQVLNNLGYTLSEKPNRKEKINDKKRRFIKITLALIISVAVYHLLNYQWSFSAISISSSSSSWAFFTFGLIAGISSCAALVGGLLLSLSKQWNTLYNDTPLVKRSMPFIMFNSGRLFSYALLGGLLGVIGGAFQLSTYATSILVLAVSIMMIIIGLQMLGTPWISRIRLQLP